MKQFIGEFKWSKAFILNLISCLLLFVSASRVLSDWRRGRQSSCYATATAPEGRLKKLSLPISGTFTLLPTLLFIFTTSLSFLKSTNAHTSFQALALVGGSLVVYFVVVHFIREHSTVRKIFWASFVTASIVSLFGISQNFQLPYLPLTQYGKRNPGSFLSLTNFAVEFLLIPFAMSVGLFAETKNRIYKCLCGLGCAIILWYLVITENRAGWIALAVEFLLALALYFYLSLHEAHRKPVFLNKASITVGLVLLLLSVLAANFTEYGRHMANRAASIFHLNDPTIKTRLLTWETALRIFKDNPILGVGLANSEINVPKYASSELETNYLQSNTKIDQIHNEYLQILVESGALGFLTFSFLIFSLVRLVIRNFKRINNHQPPFWTARRADPVYFIALIAGISGFLANIFFSFALRNPASSLYFWLSIALLEVESLRSAEQNRSKQRAAEGLKIWRRAFAFFLIAMAGLFAYLTYFSALTAKAELNYNVATAHLELKRWREVVDHSTKAIDLNPHIEKYYYVRASAYSNLNDFNSAVADLKKCTNLAPHFERAHLNLAFAYYRLGEFEKSRDEFLLAGSLMKSRRAQILDALIQVFIGLKDSKKAVEVGQDAVSLDPNNAGYHYDLAYAYAINNQYDKAAVECRKAIELKPEYTQAKAFLEEILRAGNSEPATYVHR